MLPRPPRFLALTVAATLAALAGAPRAFAQDDATADRQGLGGFHSLADGQPLGRGEFEFGIIAGWLARDGASYQGELAHTPRADGFLGDALFGVAFPSVHVADGITDFERVVSLSWQQRWRAAGDGGPTLSTQLAARVPQAAGERVEFAFAGVLATNVGVQDVAYLNLFVETDGGLGAERADWSLAAGYKTPAWDGVDWVADVLLEGDDTLTFEAAALIDLGHGLGFGPGVSTSLDLHGDSPAYGAGVVLTLAF